MSASFVRTLDVLNGVKAAIVALELAAAYSAVADYPKAFTEVQIYRNADLLKALEDMRVYDDRACFIVPGGDDFDNAIDGRVLTAKRSSDVILLIADRNYGRENLALVGDESAPGVIVLTDLVLEKLTGATLGLSGVCLTPMSGEPLHITKKEQEDALGRDGWALTFNTTAGAMRVAQPR